MKEITEEESNRIGELLIRIGNALSALGSHEKGKECADAGRILYDHAEVLMTRRIMEGKK